MREITTDEFDSVLSEDDTPLVLDIWAPWCGPCSVMGPILEELSDQYEGRIRFVKSNVDENKELASRFNVMSIPTLLIFRDGQIEDTIVGAVHPAKLLPKLESLVS